MIKMARKYGVEKHGPTRYNIVTAAYPIPRSAALLREPAACKRCPDEGDTGMARALKLPNNGRCIFASRLQKQGTLGGDHFKTAGRTI